MQEIIKNPALLSNTALRKSRTKRSFRMEQNKCSFRMQGKMRDKICAESPESGE